MAPARWSTWTKWNRNLLQTLGDAQRAQAGDASIDEAAERSTTPSVLDVHELGSKRAAGICWVLSAAELHHHFGSKTPSKKAIEGGAEKFVGQLKKGEAVAVTAYLKGLPCAVLFAGA